MRPVPAVSLLFVAALAGCFAGNDADRDAGPKPVPVSEDWAAEALPFGKGHNHTIVAHHRNLSTPNFELLGWDPLITNYHGATSGSYACGDVGMAGGRRLAIVNSFSTDIALVVVDVTNASQPVKIGELALPRTDVYDAAMLPDGSFAVLATSPPDQPDPAVATYTIRAEWTDGCGRVFQGPEQEVPYASGVVLVDLADPTNPTVADYAVLPVIGAHSVFATVVDGKRYVLGATTNLVHQVSYFNFYTVETLPVVGGRLLTYGTYQAQYPAPPSGQPPLVNGHVDGWIQKHPGTGKLLGYLADWDGGLIIVDLSSPATVTAVGAWSDYDPSKGSGMTGQIHDALPIEGTWDGKHYTFVGQEIVNHPRSRPTGQVVMLDTTDPARPAPKARWTLPVDVQWGADLQFSTHYIEVVNRTLFVTLYHGGVWAVDADPARAPELPTLGVFVPDRESPKPTPANVPRLEDWAPVVLDVLALDTGDLVVFDGPSGLYTLRWHPEVRVPVSDPWTTDAWIR